MTPQEQTHAVLQLATKDSVTEDQALELVRAIIEANGDITTDIEHKMSMFLPVGRYFETKVAQMRAAHFRKLNRNVPQQPGSRGLE